MASSIGPRQRWDKLAEGLTVAITIVIAVLVARPYAGSWNDGSRLATVESLVDRQSWIIDDSIFVQVPETPLPYSPHDRNLLEHGTLDKLFIDGHYYSDKSPVPAVLMAGFYQLWQWTTGLTARSDPDRFCRAMTIAFSGIAYVVAVWCIYGLGRRLNLSFSSQLLLTVSFALSTVALPYTRHANNHILLLAVASALVLGVARLHEEAGNGRISWRRFAFVGFLAGLGYSIDLGVGPVILLCTGCLVVSYSFSRGSQASVPLSPHPPPQPSPTRGEGQKRLPPPLWGRVGVGGSRARLRLAAKRVIIFSLAALPWLVLHHALNYAIGGSFKPANANPEYFKWPGSPFAAANLTGSWIHPNLGSFLLYAASMLAGKRGFLGHNLTLFLTIPALFVLLRRHREMKREVLWALTCCAGTWLLYAATSNNSSGQCCTIRWFVPLLAPAYFVLALLLRSCPEYRLDLVILSSWGTLLVVLMREGPWMGGMVPLFWPIQAAALGSWGLHHYLRRRGLVATTQHPYTNTSSNQFSQEKRPWLWITRTTPSSFGAHANTTSATSTSTCRATSSSSSPE